jgi:ankyrin repeat protein
MWKSTGQQLGEVAAAVHAVELRRPIEDIEVERAGVNAGDIYGNTALIHASDNSQEVAVDYLLSVGANVSKQRPEVSTGAHHCCHSFVLTEISQMSADILCFVGKVYCTACCLLPWAKCWYRGETDSQRCRCER